MKQTAKEFYDEVTSWCENTFGKDRDPEQILLHLEEELQELGKEVRSLEKGFKQDKLDFMCELADMQILLWNLSKRMGLCFTSYLDAIQIKHHLNQKRKWVKMDGKMKHLPDEVEIHEKPREYLCVVCGLVPVDALNGYDTCSNCASRI